MQKLTLTIDEEVIRNAKVYAARQKTSVSRLVEAYLKQLTSEAGEPELTGIVAELAGVLEGADLERYQKEYLAYLDDKYR